MLVNLARVIKYGFQSFLRNGWLSFATITVMILVLLVFGGLILFNVVTKATIQSLQDKIDISVYFKSNVSEDSILSVRSSLEKLAEIKSVEYISQDRALEEFKVKHKDEPVISQALAEFSTNPLLASLNIKAKDPRQYAGIADYLNNSTLQNVVEKISYAQNQIVIDRLVAIVDTVQKFGIALNIFLALVATLVTFTTIRLAIYSNSDQISVMRLVGASNWFIRAPYLISSLIYTLIGILATIAFFYPFLSLLQPYLDGFFQGYNFNITAYFNSHFLIIFGLEFLVAALVNSLASLIAVNKYSNI